MENIIKIFLALALGGILGAERSRAGKAAGFRTYMLVTLAATAFTILSKEGASFFNSPLYDPGRLVSQVILGIGFIGAGLIVYHKGHIEGITTAAGLWIATAIGMFVGMGSYVLGALITLIAFIVLTIFIKIEQYID